MKRKLLSATAVFLALGVGAALSQDKGGKGGGGGRGPQGPGLALTSPDIEDGGIIADKYSSKAGAATVSPKLQWANVPPGTVSFALLCHDPDTALQKKSDDVTHWMVFNIPGDAKELPGGIGPDAKLADGTIQIKNLRGSVGYMGMGAGAAGPYHHYTFELYALDTKLDLTPDAMRADVVNAMQGHILAKGVLVGRFHQ